MQRSTLKPFFIAAQCAILSAGLWVQEAQGLKVGDMAPDFTLEGSDGQTYTLSKLKGKTVVLAWYPRAFTGGCTVQCRSLRDNGELLKSFDVTYFRASVDTVEQNTAFAKQENANFPILSDPTKKAAEEYGVLRNVGENAISNRWTFYIDPDGKIAEIDKKVSTATSGEDMVEKLKEMNVPLAKGSET
jgi:peroxiredoxin Q/BCP